MKNNLVFREFYKRRLPHIQIAGATYFITFRLADSLPRESLEKLAEEKQLIQRLPEHQKETAHRTLRDMMSILIGRCMETDILKTSRLRIWLPHPFSSAMEKYLI
jgi:hypothetical protein